MLKRAIVGLAATCGTGYADDLGQGLKVFHLESSITYNDICYWNGAGLQFYSEDRALVSQLMKSAQRLEPTFSQREWLEMLAEEEGVCQDYRVRTTEHGINIVYNGSNIFSAMASNYYNLGGAHGNTLRTTAVIDKTNGQLKKLSDFISAPSLAKFKVFLTETLVRRTEEIIGEKIDKPEDYLFLRFVHELESIDQIEKFLVLEDGIQVLFDPYEVGPYVLGPIDVTWSYEHLQRKGMLTAQ